MRQVHGRTVSTAFAKTAIAGPVALTARGIAGDGHFDRPDPEGADHALMIFGAQNARHWTARLGLPEAPPGAFGETLTVDGAPEFFWRIGDVIAIGDARLQVSAPRLPCAILADALGQNARFPTTFLAERRVGVYVRVLMPATIEAAMPVQVVESDRNAPTIADFIEKSRLVPTNPSMLRAWTGLAGLSRIWPVLLEKRAKAIEETPHLL